MKLVQPSLEDIDSVVHTLYQIFTSDIVFAWHLGWIIGDVVDPTRWKVDPSIFNPVYKYFIRNVEVDYEIDGFVLLIESTSEVVSLLRCTRVSILLQHIPCYSETSA